MEHRTDAELLAAARTERGAFAAFYRRHVDGVLAFLVRRSDAEVGADLAAETFAIALTQADRFDPDRGEAAAWLYGIARNLLASHQRSGGIERRAQQRLGMQRVDLSDDDLERIDRLASLDVSTEVLGAALQELSSDQRDAVLARVVHEHSYAEIGRAQDLSPTVARQRVSRGLAALRHRLGGQR